MTDQELEGFAAQAFNLARTEWKQKNKFNFLLAGSYDGYLCRFRTLETLIIEKCGEDWLNSSAKKHAVSQIIRMGTKLLAPPGLCIVAIADRWKTTKAFDAVPKSEQKKILEGPCEARHAATALGLLEAEEVLIAVAQTPQRVCFYTRQLSELETTKPDVQTGDMATFDGTMKLYGEVDADFFEMGDVQ